MKFKFKLNKIKKSTKAKIKDIARKALTMMFVALLLAAATVSYQDIEFKKSDEFLRERVVMLKGDRGTCSGIQVKAPSGRVVTLSAAHCQDITTTGKIIAIYNNGDKAELKIIKADRGIDLMVLTSGNMNSIEVADIVRKQEKIHTMTHGKGLISHRSDGEILDLVMVEMALFDIGTEKEMKECIKINGRVDISIFTGLICVGQLELVRSTARVRPGSSGGAVVNENNELVGIVSATDNDDISGFVPLFKIQNYIKDL